MKRYRNLTVLNKRKVVLEKEIRRKLAAVSAFEDLIYASQSAVVDLTKKLEELDTIHDLFFHLDNRGFINEGKKT